MQGVSDGAGANALAAGGAWLWSHSLHMLLGSSGLYTTVAIRSFRTRHEPVGSGFSTLKAKHGAASTYLQENGALTLL